MLNVVKPFSGFFGIGYFYIRICNSSASLEREPNIKVKISR